MPYIMVDVKGFELTEEEKKVISNPFVGGVILFSRNLDYLDMAKDQNGLTGGRRKLIALVQEIRAIKSDIPICVEGEGGFIQRFTRHGFKVWPSNRTIGENYDQAFNASKTCGLSDAQVRAIAEQTAKNMAYDTGKRMATDLLSIGINLALGPVLDLMAGNPVIEGLDRAFDADPDRVAMLGEAFIDGLHEAGCMSVGKHFPGHGEGHDTHISASTNDLSLDELEKSHLKPFITLINNNKLFAVMPAHIRYSQVDSENVAGSSTVWMTLLREKYGFKGFVLSDCVSMAAAATTENDSLYTRVKTTSDAGCNMVIVANQGGANLLTLLSQFEGLEKTPEHQAHKVYLDAFKRKMAAFRLQAEPVKPLYSLKRTYGTAFSAQATTSSSDVNKDNGVIQTKSI